MARIRLGRVLVGCALVVALLVTSSCSVIYELSTGSKEADDLARRLEKVEGVSSADFDYQNKELHSMIHGSVVLDNLPARDWNRVIKEINDVAHRSTRMDLSLQVGRDGKVLLFRPDPGLEDLSDEVQQLFQLQDELEGSFVLREFKDDGFVALEADEIAKPVSAVSRSAALRDVTQRFKYVTLETKYKLDVQCWDHCSAVMSVLDDLSKIDGLEIPVSTNISYSRGGLSIIAETYKSESSPRNARMIDFASSLVVAVRNSKYKPHVSVRGSHEGSREECSFSWEEGQSQPRSSVSENGDPAVLKKYLEAIAAKS